MQPSSESRSNPFQAQYGKGNNWNSTCHISLSALCSGTSRLQLLLHLQPTSGRYLGTKSGMGWPVICVALSLLSSWWCFPWTCVLLNLKSKIHSYGRLSELNFLTFVHNGRFEVYWASVLWMPTLYGYSGLSRAGDLGIQDLLYFF